MPAMNSQLPCQLSGTACERFVDILVRIAEANNVWSCGPDMNQRRRVGIRIADKFIPHSHIAHRVLGSCLCPADNHDLEDISGFKPELVAGGQGVEAYRHIGGAIAAVLEGYPFLVDMQSRADLKQLRQESEAEAKQERLAELAGNQAGKQAGRLIRDYLNEAIGLEELRNGLLELLCQARLDQADSVRQT